MEKPADSEFPEFEAQFIDFNCPYCGTLLSFLETAKGVAQECFNCMQVVVVPAAGTEVGRKLPIPLTTPRLLLRRLQQDDREDLLAFVNDEEVMRFINTARSTEETVAHWLNEDAKLRLTQPGQTLFLAMVLRTGGTLIGYVTVSLIDHAHVQAEIGVVVNRTYHRKGYAKEAVRGTLAFCFAGINVHRVVASCDSRNVAGRRLLGSAGLRQEGEFVQDQWVKGEWINTCHYGLLHSEYSSSPDLADRR
jgi:RimJ/RimL family protein N-acetyltransferase